VAFDVTLERRIRELCAQAVVAQDGDEVQSILSELRQALRQHVEQIQSIVAEYPFAPVDVEKILPPSNGSEKLADNKKKKAV
jgi:hypothetical protein